MAIIQGLEWTFNTVAAEYDKWSPTYIQPLYDDLLAYQPINPASHVLEIGIGTGQATAPILKTGCTLTAVELGDQLAELSRQKFAEYQSFSVVNTAFQNYECAENTFNLIYSARAFHWIPEDIGYPKVYAMLKSGGAFVRFAGHPNYSKEQGELNAEIQKVYEEYMPYSKPSPQFTEEDAKRKSDIAGKYGFVDISFKLYFRTRTYNSDEYASLISVYSNHIVLEEGKKACFYNGIRSAIRKHGGTITLMDTIELNLARKP